ncbi:MAG TPA: M48 family metallopeptidase [Cytophagaceae bacterium]
MKNLYTIIFTTLLFFSSCSTVPVTGRRQLDLVPQSQVLALSQSSYQDFMSKNKLSADAQNAAMVKRVGQNIANAVEKYMRDNNMSKELKGYTWEFNLVDDKAVNAWCMPGGKVVVYTGILPVAHDDKGLAVVMGHEIAHAVAKHGNERMSQGLTAQLGGVALQIALRDKPALTQNLFFSAYGIGSQVGVLLPFSRLQESEADELGLVFMAMAGYDPNEAVSFWQRMNAQQTGGSPPEFLSTHPAHETRIKDIQKHIPKAMTYYSKTTATK